MNSNLGSSEILEQSSIWQKTKTGTYVQPFLSPETSPSPEFLDFTQAIIPRTQLHSKYSLQSRWWSNARKVCGAYNHRVWSSCRSYSRSLKSVFGENTSVPRKIRWLINLIQPNLNKPSPGYISSSFSNEVTEAGAASFSDPCLMLARSNRNSMTAWLSCKGMQHDLPKTHKLPFEHNWSAKHLRSPDGYFKQCADLLERSKADGDRYILLRSVEKVGPFRGRCDWACCRSGRRVRAHTVFLRSNRGSVSDGGSTSVGSEGPSYYRRSFIRGTGSSLWRWWRMRRSMNLRKSRQFAIDRCRLLPEPKGGACPGLRGWWRHPLTTKKHVGTWKWRQQGQCWRNTKKLGDAIANIWSPMSMAALLGGRKGTSAEDTERVLTVDERMWNA